MESDDNLAAPPDDPYRLFADWYREANACEAIQYAAATCLSTIDLEGQPDGRIVLVHAFDASGFAFFTDARSTKGRSLKRVPEAAFTFYWGPLERQVRVQGSVRRASSEEADAFFRERPRRSKVTAWASEQSQPLTQRDVLDQRVAQFEAQFADEEEIPRPPYWQAYRLLPRTVEFWAARPRRLHDRVRYMRSEAGGWEITRLFP